MAKVETKNCPQCGAPIDGMATVCRYCGAELVVQPQVQTQYQQDPQYVQYQPQPGYVLPQNAQYAQAMVPPYASPAATSPKSKIAAGVLAILLGGLGVHKFYLGKIGQGILYLIFCWTAIPSFIGIIEGIIYLTSSDEKFYSKYVKK